MSKPSTYRKLFSVNIKHDGFLDLGYKSFSDLDDSDKTTQLKNYNIWDYLSITPTRTTQKQLTQNKLRLYETKSGFDILAMVSLDESEVASPFIEIEDSLSLKFSLKIHNDNFFYAANLSPEEEISRHYYFSTKKGHVSGSELHLTNIPKEFEENHEYRSGNIIVDDSENPTQHWEAIEDFTSTATQDLEQWIDLTATPYINSSPQHLTGVSKDDLIDIYHSNFAVNLPAQTNYAMIQVIEPESSDVVFTQQFMHATGEALDVIQASLPNSLPEGGYELKVLDSSGVDILPAKPFHLLKMASNQAYFALIEIDNTNESLAFLNSEKELTSPEYHIRFRRRHAYWKYLVTDKTNSLDTESSENFTSETVEGLTQLTSNAPLPYSEKILFLEELELDNSEEDSGTLISLPNPHFSTLKREEGKQMCEAHIYI